MNQEETIRDSIVTTIQDSIEIRMPDLIEINRLQLSEMSLFSDYRDQPVYSTAGDEMGQYPNISAPQREEVIGAIH